MSEMQWTHRMASILVLLPAMATAGCGLGAFQPAKPNKPAADAPPTTTGTERTLTPQSEPPLERLPLPVGFKLDPRASHRYHTDEGRVLLHVYRGPASKDEVERFYRHVMPLTGWDYQGSQMVRGAVELRFEQEDEWADLTIRDHWTLLGGKGSRIEARIQTLAPSSGAKEPQQTGESFQRAAPRSRSAAAGATPRRSPSRTGRRRIAR